MVHNMFLSSREEYMEFNGEVVFDIADEGQIEVDFGTNILPTKVVNKGDTIALGRKAPKYRWMYEIKYSCEREYLNSLEKMLNQLCERREYVNHLTKIYEEVCINVYIRSDFAEIGYSLSNHILKKISVLECVLNFHVLSFGMVYD